MKTIKRNDSGAAVEDIQARLRKLGFKLNIDGVYADRTQEAVRAFRKAEGLPEGDTIDQATWTALVDATFSLGDRLLYLRMPYFHGSDVYSLQNILSVLGFSMGKVDGIFGTMTESALRDFQASVGLVDDGVAGNTTFDAIFRLRHAWEGKSATTAKTDDYYGFARAEEALLRMEACFYGLDEFGRKVASRVANLALATTPEAKVASAESMNGIPLQSTLMVGVFTADEESKPEGIPVVSFSSDFRFPQRLRTAIDSAGQKPRRIAIEVPSSHLSKTTGHLVEGERWQQHLAVVLLDAFCAAI